MEFKKFGCKYIIRMDKGDEIIETLKSFCKDQNIKLGSVIGLGAVDRLTIGLFETGIKTYHSTEITGDYEITSFNANISTMKGDVYLHAHICVSDKEYKTFGGHLNKAFISATGEFIVESIDGEVDREFSEEIGLNLYKF
jgi:uncharacterized protein